MKLFLRALSFIAASTLIQTAYAKVETPRVFTQPSHGCKSLKDITLFQKSNSFIYPGSDELQNSYVYTCKGSRPYTWSVPDKADENLNETQLKNEIVRVGKNQSVIVNDANTGLLPRPILFVHGFTGDMYDFGSRIHSEQYPEKSVGYDPGSVSETIAHYYGVYYTNATEDESEIIKQNSNGLEYFATDNRNADDLEYQAEQLYNRVKQVLEEYYGSGWRNNSKASIDLIGMSQGGLTIRQMLTLDSDEGLANPINHINHILTVNTPHYGTEWAGRADGKPETVTKEFKAIRTVIHNVIESTALSNELYEAITGEGFLELAKAQRVDLFIKEKNRYKIGSSFLRNLGSNPKMPRNDSPISFTTFFGTANGALYEWYYARYDHSTTDEVKTNCTNYGINPNKKNLLACYVIAFEGTLGDENAWMLSGDFVSSVYSMKGDDVFDYDKPSIKAIELLGTNFHGNVDEIPTVIGGNYRGQEILSGLLSVPENTNFKNANKNLKFSGRYQKVTVPNRVGLEPDKYISISADVVFDQKPSRFELVRKQKNNGRGYDIRWEREGQLAFYVNIGGSWKGIRWEDTNYWKTGTHYTIQCVYNGSTMRIIVDGVTRVSRQMNGAMSHDGSPLLIGSAYPYDSSYNFKGYISNLKLVAGYSTSNFFLSTKYYYNTFTFDESLGQSVSSHRGMRAYRGANSSEDYYDPTWVLME